MKSLGSWVLLAHATIVLGSVALFLHIYASESPTGPFDLLLPYFPLLVFGLPWSLEFVLGDYNDDWGRSVWFLVVLGPAMLNVVVHGLIRWVWVAARRVNAGTWGRGGDSGARQ